MARLDLRVFIRATPGRVWEILSDLRGQHRWMVDVCSLRVTSETQSGVGTVIELTSELFGLPLILDVMEITAWEPARRLEVVHRGQFSGSAAFELEPALDGTVFYWWEEFEPPLGHVGELGFLLLVGPHLRRVFARSMENVRRLAEANPARPLSPGSSR